MIEQIKKIAEQVEENESKKLLLESEITHLEEVLKHGISTRFVEENAIYIYSPKMGHEIRKKLEEDYKLMHSKLSIPKKIAQELERYDFELTSAGLMYRNSDGKLTEFFSETNREVSQLTTQTIVGNYRLVYAYINPLTRPFVEVTNE